MMRRYPRREFLGLAGGAAAAAWLASCGDDGAGGGATATRPAPTPAVSAGDDAGAVGLRWFGQSMFLLTSPGGSTVLLDPFNDIGYTLPPPLDAEATTITHEHPDHNNGPLGGGASKVLRGLTSDGWAEVDETVGDIRIRIVRSFHDAAQGAQRGRNAIFVYETGGLRLVHLGDLGHGLESSHISQIGGPVDVLMVPVGGTFTIDAAGATEAVNALKPRMVFPMHYKTDRIALPLATVDAFLDGKTVRRVGSTTMRIAKDSLPDAAAVMVLDYE